MRWFEVSTILAAFLGGGIISTFVEIFRDRQSDKAESARVKAAIAADIRRASEIARHNEVTANPTSEARPRAFIEFPTTGYEELMFNGTMTPFVGDDGLAAVMSYLTQAYHVNKMIVRFETLEQRAPTSGYMDRPVVESYLKEIEKYCSASVPRILSELMNRIERGG